MKAYARNNDQAHTNTHAHTNVWHTHERTPHKRVVPHKIPEGGGGSRGMTGAARVGHVPLQFFPNFDEDLIVITCQLQSCYI